MTPPEFASHPSYHEYPVDEVLDRPANERPFLVLVVGYPAADARVPSLTRKPLEEIATFL